MTVLRARLLNPSEQRKHEMPPPPPIHCTFPKRPKSFVLFWFWSFFKAPPFLSSFLKTSKTQI